MSGGGRYNLRLVLAPLSKASVFFFHPRYFETLPFQEAHTQSVAADETTQHEKRNKLKGSVCLFTEVTPYKSGGHKHLGARVVV